MEISINLNVLFDLTARMAKTLTALAGRQPQPAAPAVALPEPAESDKPAPASDQPAPASDQPTPAPEPVAPAPEPAASAPEPAPTPAQAKELTAEDVRDAIDRTRRRFEGEDYAQNTDTEEYKRYHKALTAFFKQSAMVLAGVTKPSLLPPDKIADFIADCEAITLDENGNLALPKAPF